jgi:tripartite-type tricarboxylate transporter receptor subunit TctC
MARFAAGKAVIILCALFGASITPVPVAAQEWPSRPIRILTPLAAGGAVDVLARVVGEELFATLKQPFVIENRPGAGGTLAATTAMRAAPDGYTLLLGTAGALAISPVLSKNAPYDPVKDFTPLTAAVELPICLVVHKDVPVNTIPEFIAYAKANPGKLSFGSSGPNTTHHLAGEYLKFAAGIDMIHVPYRGGGPAMNDLIAGQIPALFATLSTTIPYMESGKLKVLGMVEARRSAAYPDIPTIGETVPGYAVPPSFIGFVAPPGLPEPLTRQISAALVQAIGNPSVRKALTASGFEVGTSTPAEFAEILRTSVDRYRKIATDARIEAQ